MSLVEYNKKRVFKKTPEPRGVKNRATKRQHLQFVVQKHSASRLHCDFRLELDGILKSWAVPKGPSMNPEDKRLAIMTEDHPLSYGSFEGKIPKGEYGAGEVIVWDTGVYTSTETADLERSRKSIKSGLYKGEFSFVLLGEKLKGAFTLIRMKDNGENAWLLIKQKDAYATASDILKDESKKTIKGKKVRAKKAGRTSRRKKKDPMPHHIKPMLAKRVNQAFSRKGWLFEIKWDGYRAIAEIKNENISLYSRNGNSFADTYTPIIGALAAEIPHDCVLDGEIVALVKNKSSFNALQHYKENKVPLQYIVFDLLYLDGVDLRGQPLIERKKLLKKIIPEKGLILYSDHVEDTGEIFFKKVTKENIEGVVAKNSRSPYREGVRSDEWLKIKSTSEQEAVIVGYTKPRGSRKFLGALVLAVYEREKLVYIGHSGGGFTDAEMKNLYQKLHKIKTSRSPLQEKVPVNSPITWVTPKYVCQLKFAEWTKDGRMRHPIYLGLREDKHPKEVTKEMTATGPEHTAQPALTNLEKVFWPDERYTKGDVISYYERIADVLLPYLKDRPQNLNRHPNGINGKHFFQKNIEMDLPTFVETQEIWSESNSEYLRYIVCQNKETLLYLANLGCIELNPWNSRIQHLEKPDYLILDLDPNGRSFDDLIIVAKEVRSVLLEACEEFYLKTSGKSGLHIVLPLSARYTYDDIRNFSELLMRLVLDRLPVLTSMERSPKKRKGKIYLDYLQNRFGQTLACAYSLRPYPGATISTPIEWSELRKGFSPAKFTIETICKRLDQKGDLWKPVVESKGIPLADAIRCLEETFRKIKKRT